MATKASEAEKNQILQDVTCNLPGFEGVILTFDLMASFQQANNFARQMGGVGSHSGVVAKVENWPKDEYGPDPWDAARVPSVWFAWASKKGWALAMKAYLDDPNS